MKVKTSELQGAALDWAVAKCECITPVGSFLDGVVPSPAIMHQYHPSTDWAQGGPIIAREWLDITPWPNESDESLRWQCNQHDSIDCIAFGPTPLIAAMRCYVTSKLGDEIDVPEELS